MLHYLIQQLFGYLVLLGLTLWSTAHAASHPPPHLVQYGVASWYGKPFHGRLTANGERYDMYQLTAAHKQAPLGIHAIITHMRTGRQVRVRITDRGPFVKGRLIDLSYGAARQLGMVQDGLAPVMIEFLPDTQPEITFMVQAGSYQNAQYALAAKRRIGASYPNVLIRKLPESKTPIYQVLLGPFKTRRHAEAILQGIGPLGYKGLIIPQTQTVSSLPPGSR
ncbi:septal ring lytic transglycosylase RlpA family protein [Candidatus Entotheonella palauensis]|uniref:septal ring lytic transglycosylase RlpA family protein n=1 Tax=Candidatus Entotheonella palauensis TaxID=93172 RepID=UPI0015C46C0B|nr:septal ring lytic transglycosylase RlpA family protein [Candidatus Entotheonella palauensis]